MTEASAPAKIILLGEHAVVYGQPAIAMPVSGLRAYAKASPNDGGGLTIEATDLGVISHITTEKQYENDNPLHAVVHLVLKELKKPLPDLNIAVQSQIPLASGLGSGAAISTAIARVLASALNCNLNDETFNQIVYQVEKIHHGTPSGVDNTVIVYERPIYFVRGGTLNFFSVQGSFQFLIANTGISASTKVAVEDVARLYKANPDHYGQLFQAMGMAVTKGLVCLQSGDAAGLGSLMTQNHDYLQQLTVSSPELDRLVQTALDAGALGAKLSGGGRGGNMIALVTQNTLPVVKNELVQAGAAHVFEATLG